MYFEHMPIRCHVPAVQVHVLYCHKQEGEPVQSVSFFFCEWSRLRCSRVNRCQIGKRPRSGLTEWPLGSPIFLLFFFFAGGPVTVPPPTTSP